LLVPIRKPAGRKALLAIAFAGGMLNSQLPALSDSKSESTDSVIQQIANSTQITPEVRAYYLLRLASRYLAGDDRAVAEAQFKSVGSEPSRSWLFINSRMDKTLASWADQISVGGRSTNHLTKVKKEAEPGSQSIADENSVLADTAIQKALIQLDKASENFATLNMYFIASRLFQEMGNTDGVRKCNTVLKKAFQSCEGNSLIDEEQIKAAASVLNSMANGLIPVYIQDVPWGRQTQVKSFTEKDFKESEKLKLRAVAMVDRLDTKNHLRRKAHRDLALWYMQFDKMEMAEKEKQTLFKLVGFEDDSVLYPQQAECGQLIWWQKEHRQITGVVLCGMG
jgi:hypothetical protein